MVATHDNAHSRVMEAPDKAVLAAWFQKMQVPCDHITPVELVGEHDTATFALFSRHAPR